MRFKKIVMYLFLINFFISLFTIGFQLAKEKETLSKQIKDEETRH